jgi:hypothetical protein
MTLNRSKTLLTFSASLLLVAAYAASSDARPHAQRLSPTQATSSTKAAPAYVYPNPTLTPGAVFTEDASTHNG